VFLTPCAIPQPLHKQPFIPEFGTHHLNEPGHAHNSELDKVSRAANDVSKPPTNLCAPRMACVAA